MTPALRLALLPVIAVMVLMPSTLPVPVLKGLVQDRFGLSVFETTWFMSVQLFGAFLAAPFVGALSDRFGRRKPLVVAALLLDAAAIAALTGELSFGWFLAVRFFDGAMHITALSLLMTLAADGAGPARRGRVLGLVGCGLTLGVTLGAALGGVLGRVDPLRPLQVGVVVSIAAAVLALFALREAPLASRRPGFRAALAAMVRERSLLAPIAFAAVDRFTVGFYVSVFPLWLRDVHGLSASTVGMLLATFLLPFSLLSYPFGRVAERRSRIALICGGSVLYGATTCLLGFVEPPWIWVVMAFLGVCSAVMFVPSMILLADLAGSHWKGAAMGAFNSAGSLGFALGPLVGGKVVDALGESRDGYTAAFAVAGGAELCCVAITLPVLLRLVRTGRTT